MARLSDYFIVKIFYLDNIRNKENDTVTYSTNIEEVSMTDALENRKPKDNDHRTELQGL